LELKETELWSLGQEASEDKEESVADKIKTAEAITETLVVTEEMEEETTGTGLVITGMVEDKTEMEVDKTEMEEGKIEMEEGKTETEVDKTETEEGKTEMVAED